MDYGIQLYSVKDFMKKDVKGTLAELASYGYTMVEPAGFFDVPAEQFKAWCDELGLKVSGSHQNFGQLENGNADTTLSYLKTIGCKNYIIAGAPSGNAAEVDELIRLIQKWKPILNEQGFELTYHNHSREFLPNEDGLLAHVEMQKRTDIEFEIDVYWAYRGLVNPIYLLEQLKERIHVIHVKDGNMETGTPLGLGTTPIREVVAWAKKNNVALVVENEPEAEKQMVEAKVCIDYLKSLE